MILLARANPAWRDTLMVVKPETLLSWHRNLFRIVWRCKSRPKGRQPRITPETIELIKQMARDNHLWGAERIRGELLKPGIQGCKRTIQKHMDAVRPRRGGGQDWRTFMSNTLLDHDAPRFLIKNNDNKSCALFKIVADSEKIEVFRTPIRGPRANAFCERFLGSLRRECLDHILILIENHLRRTVAEYIRYHNACRPHQGFGQVIPMGVGSRREPTGEGKVVATPILGGLHHDYRRAA